MIKLDPFEHNLLVGVTSNELEIMNYKDIYALHSGDGSINIVHTMSGHVYLTTENNLTSGFSKAF